MKISYQFNGITQISFASSWYALSVALRYDILRKPLQLNYTVEQLDLEKQDFHIAFIENQIVLGCLILTPKENGIIKMRQVAVAQHLQGKGIGKKLVIFSEIFSLEKGYNQMELNARETAIPFYLSLDYQKIGDEFIEVGIPHYKMIKKLF